MQCITIFYKGHRPFLLTLNDLEILSFLSGIAHIVLKVSLHLLFNHITLCLKKDWKI